MTEGLQSAARLSARDVQTYQVCEDLTEGLIYFTVVFTPWAFGTTQPWAMWAMNVAGYSLGTLLALKLGIRWFKGFHAPRWGEEPAVFPDSDPNLILSLTRNPINSEMQRGLRESLRQRLRFETKTLSATLAGLTLIILAYCFISAVNARSTYHREELSFVDHRFIKWLPHSFDSNRTWALSWNYLGLACSFWALRDWLLGKSGGEERAQRQKSGAGQEPAPLFPARLRRLLWLLAINGGLVGLEGIVQRVSGSSKLLFLVQPRVNPEGYTQFGPYAYRANAAAYFNLLWPVVLGFWWTLQRGGGLRRGGPYFLLIAAAIMAACPAISTCRGGALVTAIIVGMAALILACLQFCFPQRKEARRSGRTALGVLGLSLAAGLALGYILGWKTLGPRLAEIQESFENREQMYAAAWPMARDYPLFGVGPGAFEPVFQLYRISTDTYWPAQLHNDWLETQITFGWLGSGLIGLALLTVLVRWFARGGIHGGRRFMILTWLALGGCLVHARFDLPFQIYSIVWTFLILCAIAVNLSRRP